MSWSADRCGSLPTLASPEGAPASGGRQALEKQWGTAPRHRLSDAHPETCHGPAEAPPRVTAPLRSPLLPTHSLRPARPVRAIRVRVRGVGAHSGPPPPGLGLVTVFLPMPVPAGGLAPAEGTRAVERWTSVPQACPARSLPSPPRRQPSCREAPPRVTCQQGTGAAQL